MDIASLTDWILHQLPPGPGGSAHVATDSTLRLLQSFDWPANVRELRKVLELSAERAGKQPIAPRHLPSEVRQRAEELTLDFEPLRELERKYILEVMRSVRSKRKAAEVLGIAPSTLYDKIARYRIQEQL